MKFTTNSTGEITLRIVPARGTEHFYADMLDGEIPPGATHFRDGQFLKKPDRPSDTHVWDEDDFCWVVSNELVATAYVAQRRAAYPAIGDQLDALWKGGDALESMRQKVLAVKTAIPKPQGSTE